MYWDVRCFGQAYAEKRRRLNPANSLRCCGQWQDMCEDVDRERIQKLIEKLKLKNEDWNALGVMLLISRREKTKDKIDNNRKKKKRNHWRFRCPSIGNLRARISIPSHFQRRFGHAIWGLENRLHLHNIAFLDSKQEVRWILPRPKTRQSGGFSRYCRPTNYPPTNACTRIFEIKDRLSLPTPNHLLAYIWTLENWFT